MSHTFIRHKPVKTCNNCGRPTRGFQIVVGDEVLSDTTCEACYTDDPNLAYNEEEDDYEPNDY